MAEPAASLTADVEGPVVQRTAAPLLSELIAEPGTSASYSKTCCTLLLRSLVVAGVLQFNSGRCCDSESIVFGGCIVLVVVSCSCIGWVGPSCAGVLWDSW
ncbi:unnamed protein product [Ostreobium quekettii]|nr:unnamed protein product [Ostreobium quekettii]